jgi:hypothetical protein
MVCAAEGMGCKDLRPLNLAPKRVTDATRVECGPVGGRRGTKQPCTHFRSLVGPRVDNVLETLTHARPEKATMGEKEKCAKFSCGIGQKYNTNGGHVFHWPTN